MSCRIVFMGTPDFAVPCLQRLLDDGYDVTGVFCQPDRPKGRGYQLAAPPVKELALMRDIPVYQPASLRDGAALEILREHNPDLVVVVAYGRILPADILDLPPLGCINVHASLLPALRGAAPIQWSIVNGDAVTGVTTMYMAEGMDTGDIILQRETPIGENETAGQLFARLAPLGAAALSESVPLLLDGTAPRIAQREEDATYAPIIRKEMGCIDFTKPAAEACNLVRGMHPWPGAYMQVGDKRLKVHAARAVEGYSGAPGKLLADDRLVLGCGEGAVELLSIQPPGKKPMDGAAFLNGYRGLLLNNK